MLIEPEISGASIVLVGSFNPRIFTPDWFARHELLPEAEVAAAKIEIIHQQVSHFRTDRLVLLVEQERIVATTTYAPFVWLRDLVVRTFRECLPHTPIGKLGINREIHYAVEDMAKRDRIGHRLAPPDVWGDWAPMIKAGEGDRHGGMLSLTMQQRELDDRPKGYIQATVQPSIRIPGSRGIYVQINDHYEIEGVDKVAGAEEITALLEANFDKSLARSEWIVDQVMRIDA